MGGPCIYVVERRRIELPTFALRTRRSSQLSYPPTNPESLAHEDGHLAALRAACRCATRRSVPGRVHVQPAAAAAHEAAGLVQAVGSAAEFAAGDELNDRAIGIDRAVALHVEAQPSAGLARGRRAWSVGCRGARCRAGSRRAAARRRCSASASTRLRSARPAAARRRGTGRSNRHNAFRGRRGSRGRSGRSGMAGVG